MNTVLYGTKVLSIVNSMSTGLIIKLLTTTTRSVCDLISYISKSNEPKLKEIKSVLYQLDILFCVSVIEEFIREYEYEDLSDAIRNAITGVTNSLELIKTELQQIKDLEEDHNKKYFNSWRSFDCSNNITQIKNDKQILDKRYKLLIDLIKIQQKN